MKTLSFVLVILFGFLSCNFVKKQKEPLKNPHYLYFSNGQVKAEISIKDDKKHGVSKWFYQNGQVESITNFLEGKKVGSAIFYDSLGNVKQYSFYRNGGHLYQRIYDKDKQIIKEEGTPFYSYSNQESFCIDSNFIFQVVVARPENTVFNYSVFEKNTDSSLEELLNVKNLSKEIYSVQYPLKDTGEVELLLQVTLIDTINQTQIEGEYTTWLIDVEDCS